MNLRGPQSGFPRQALYGVIVIVCVASLPWSSSLVLAQEAPQDQSQETTTAEEAPKVFTHIHLTYHMGGVVSKKAAEDAVSLSKNKYCSVSKMLEKAAKIDYVITYGEKP